MKQNHTLTVVLAGASALLIISGCSQPALTSNDRVIEQACTQIVSELKTTGLSLAELAPKDLTQVDGATLAKAYDTGASALSRARDKVSDVKVGEVIDTAETSMRELAPLTEAAAAGDPGKLTQAVGPLSRLASVAMQCSTVLGK